MPNKEDIRACVIDIIEKGKSEIYDDVLVESVQNIFTDLGFSSITIMQAIVEIEETYSIDLSDLLYDDICDLNRLIECVWKKTQNNNEDKT